MESLHWVFAIWQNLLLRLVRLASDACGYPYSPTRLLREVPQAPFGIQIFNLWLRVLANAFDRDQLTAGHGLFLSVAARSAPSSGPDPRCS